MTSRFISNVLVLVAAMAVLSFSLVFQGAVLGWIGLGLACWMVLVILAAFPARGRGVAQRVVDALIALAGGWLIVASRCFGGAPLKWISFGTGALVACFALIGLVVHEISMELALRPMAREPGDRRMRGSVREQAPAR